MDVGQPTKEEETNFEKTMSRSRRRRGKRVLLNQIASDQMPLNLGQLFRPGNLSKRTNLI